MKSTTAKIFFFISTALFLNTFMKFAVAFLKDLGISKQASMYLPFLFYIIFAFLVYKKIFKEKGVIIPLGKFYLKLAGLFVVAYIGILLVAFIPEQFKDEASLVPKSDREKKIEKNACAGENREKCLELKESLSIEDFSKLLREACLLRKKNYSHWSCEMLYDDFVPSRISYKEYVDEFTSKGIVPTYVVHLGDAKSKSLEKAQEVMMLYCSKKELYGWYMLENCTSYANHFAKNGNFKKTIDILQNIIRKKRNSFDTQDAFTRIGFLQEANKIEKKYRVLKKKCIREPRFQKTKSDFQNCFYTRLALQSLYRNRAFYKLNKSLCRKGDRRFCSDKNSKKEDSLGLGEAVSLCKKYGRAWCNFIFNNLEDETLKILFSQRACVQLEDPYYCHTSNFEHPLSLNDQVFEIRLKNLRSSYRYSYIDPDKLTLGQRKRYRKEKCYFHGDKDILYCDKYLENVAKDIGIETFEKEAEFICSKFKRFCKDSIQYKRISLMFPGRSSRQP
jgi:hypothetical protein